MGLAHSVLLGHCAGDTVVNDEPKRRALQSKAFLQKEKPLGAPVREVLASHLPSVAQVVVLAFGQNAGY